MSGVFHATIQTDEGDFDLCIYFLLFLNLNFDILLPTANERACMAPSEEQDEDEHAPQGEKF